MRLIGLTGDVGSGKDTVGNILMSNFAVRKAAFADPIRYALAGMLGVHVNQFGDRRLKEKHIGIDGFGEHVTNRFLMRTLGTEWGRDVVDEDIWIYLMRNKLASMSSPSVVITDVRFPNEVEFIKENGGEIWRIERPDNPLIVEKSHASDNAIDNMTADLTIFNDGTLTDLQRAVEVAFGELTVKGVS